MSNALGRRSAAAATLLVLLAAMMFPVSARAQAAGRIDGQVSNGTAGAAIPADLPVTLHIFKDRAKVGEKATQTDANGQFAIGGLETEAGYVYFPVVEYGGATYFPERPITLDQSPRQTAEIRVFEPTTSDEAITFDRSNLLVLRVTPTALTLMEMDAVVNNGDRTYVGGGASDPDGGGTLRFAVPPGAAEITPQAGFPPNAVVATPDGFASTSAIVPGRHELAFSYQLPYDSATLDLVRRQLYPTTTFNLYVPDTGLTVVSPDLQYQGASELGGQRYQLYSAQRLPRGGELQIRIGNLPAPWGPKPTQVAVILTAVCALTLGGAVLYAMRQRRFAVAAPTAVPAAAGTADRERLSLIRSLAELDDRYEAGEIEETRYHEERERGKARLIAIGMSRD